MKKTYTVTITLTYDNVGDEKELRTAVFNEAKSWVDSGSFGEDLYCSEGGGVLVDDSVTIEAKQ